MPFIKHEELPDIKGAWSHKEEKCHDPEHNPPTMIVLKPGVHTYQCPSCGHTQSIRVQKPEMTFHP